MLLEVTFRNKTYEKLPNLTPRLTYHDKILQNKDYQLIKNMTKIPSKQTFHRDLKQISPNLRAHDFRYQYARNLFAKKVSELGYNRTIEIISKSLNHNRLEISLYYLKG